MHTNTVACLDCLFCNNVTDCASASPRCARCQRWLPWIAAADDDNFVDIVQNCPVPVLMDMCGGVEAADRWFSPAPVRLAIERAGALKLVKVDVEAAPNLTQRFAVHVVPTLLLIDHGLVLGRYCGVSSIATLRTWLDAAVRSRGAVNSAP